MNVVLLNKCRISAIVLTVQQQFRLAHEDDLYSSLPEVLSFFWYVEEICVPLLIILHGSGCALGPVVMAPYSINSLLKVETQHLRLMYPRRSCSVSLWLLQHAHAATSEYDSNPTSGRQISEGSLANRQGRIAPSLLLPSWPLPSFPSYPPPAGRAALLS